MIGEVQHIWTAPIARSPPQEGETLLASPHGIHACAAEIADRFTNRIKNPDRSEIAEAVLQGEFCESLQSVLIRACRQSATARAAVPRSMSCPKKLYEAAGLVAERQATAPHWPVVWRVSQHPCPSRRGLVADGRRPAMPDVLAANMGWHST